MERDLAYEFEVDQSTVSRIFTKWIIFLHLRLGDLPLWPSWEGIELSMPDCFKQSYPTTFSIIDATELKSEMPSSLPLQSQLYSSYKSHTTTKGLVAIALNGCFTFQWTIYWLHLWPWTSLSQWTLNSRFCFVALLLSFIWLSCMSGACNNSRFLFCEVYQKIYELGGLRDFNFHIITPWTECAGLG